LGAIASIVLFSDRCDEVTAFYRGLGLDLQDEDHGDGRLHAACELGDVHFAVLATDEGGDQQSWGQSGSTFVGLWVPVLEEAVEAARRFGAPVLHQHQQCAWGCRIVVADPDGRAVELNQEDHCPERE
jgi:lactoylglutathione lyase